MTMKTAVLAHRTCVCRRKQLVQSRSRIGFIGNIETIMQFFRGILNQGSAEYGARNSASFSSLTPKGSSSSSASEEDERALGILAVDVGATS